MAKKNILIIKFIIELIKYWVGTIIGDEATNTLLKGLSDIFSESLIKELEKFLDQGTRTEEFLEAFNEADKCFYSTTDDNQLKQAIISKPLAGIPRLTELAKLLPMTLDDKGLLDILKLQFQKDWKDQLTDVQIENAAVLYRICLDKSLAVKCGQLLPSIFRMLDRIKGDIQDIKKSQLDMTRLLEQIRDNQKIQYTITNAYSHNELLILADKSPNFPKLFIPRKDIINRFIENFNSFPWLALIDSSGKGKSLLALSIAQQIQCEVKWITFKHINGNLNIHLYDQLVLWLDTLEDNTQFREIIRTRELLLDEICIRLGNILKNRGLIIIDDLPDPVGNEELFHNIITIIHIFIEHNIFIITTSQRNLPPFVYQYFLGLIKTCSVPNFESEDILSFLILSRAPSEYHNENLVSVIAAISKGHPSLVTAIISWLKQHHWSYADPIIDNLISGEPIREVQEYYRRIMFNTLSDEQKELLFRLSIIGNKFSRTIALDISNLSPKIQYSGAILESLIGPWVEQGSHSDFYVSPLIDNSGEENLSFEIQQKIHRLIVKSLMHDNKINAMNAFSVLIHLWQAKDFLDFCQVLFVLLTSIINESQANYFIWAAGLLYGVPWPDEIDNNWRILIRSAQVRVLSLANKNYHPHLLELDNIIKNADPRENWGSILFALGSTGLIGWGFPVEISLDRAFKYTRFVASNKTILGKFPEVALLAEDAIWIQAIHLQGTQQVDLFLELFSTLTLNEINLIGNGKFSLEACVHIFNQHIITEALKPQEDQNWCELFTKLENLSVRINIRNFFQMNFGCALSQAIIIGEYFGDKKQAIQKINQIDDHLEDNAVFINNYFRGIYSSDLGNIQLAIEYFSKAADTKGDAFFHYRFDNERRYGIEKARNADWIGARNQFIKAINTINNSEFREIYSLDKYEIYGEIAHIYWNTKEWGKVCAALLGYIMGLLSYEGNRDQRYLESYYKAFNGLGIFLTLCETGKVVDKNLEILESELLQAGMFGIRRELLKKNLQNYNTSKAVLLSHLGRLAFENGKFRLARYVFYHSLEYLVLEGSKFFLDFSYVYWYISVLEMILSGPKAAIHNNLKAIQYFSVVLNLGNKYNTNTSDVEVIKVLDLDRKNAEKFSLSYFLIPLITIYLAYDFPQSNIEKNLTELAECIKSNDLLFFKEEWIWVITHFLNILLLKEEERNPEVNISEFGDNKLFQIIDGLLLSVKTKLPLNKALVTQISACIALVDYKIIGQNLLINAIGKILYNFWSNVANTQRFAINNPDQFLSEMNNTSPNMGGLTIVKVIINSSKTLGIRIPLQSIEMLQKLCNNYSMTV